MEPTVALQGVAPKPLIVLDVSETLIDLESLMPHPEVPAALTRLRNAGFRLFTLADDAIETQMRQLTSGGIADCFERLISSFDAKTHTPSRRAYAYAEKQLGVPPSRLLLIACHVCDIQGALGAGWRAAFIKRSWNEVLRVGPQPDLVGSDLADVADELITQHE